jgi:hypothetical protein
MEYTIAYYCYLIAASMTILIGLLYATRRQVMPYHLKALQTSWDAIVPNYQLLLRALLNGGGYYGISVGLSMMVLLLIPYSNHEHWAGYAIGVIGLIGTIPLTWIVYTVKTKTAGDPPLWIMILIDALLICGLIATIIS